MVIRRFEVWLVNLDPTIGNEIKKTRPALIVSPDITNISQYDYYCPAYLHYQTLSHKGSMYFSKETGPGCS
jgi:hypothetical protein